jgi:hypothetical protein
MEDMKMKINKLLIIFIISFCFLTVVFSQDTTNDNYWEKFKKYDSYLRGKNDYKLTDNEANKLVDFLILKVFVVYFEPINNFKPKNPKEFMDKFFEISKLTSEDNSLGGASVFRSKNENGKYIGSFLTIYPDKLKQDIKKSNFFKLVKEEKITKEYFNNYIKTTQEDFKIK